jgi:hypothetical protein
MKKLLLLIFGVLILSSVLLMACSGEKDDTKNENEPIEFIFHGYGAEAIVPDFFTAEQGEIYKMAISLYHISLDPTRLDNARFFPLKEGQEYIAPNDPWFPDFTADNGNQYSKSVGRYRKWADFEKLVLAVFTPEAFNGLNKFESFIEIDGDLYLLGATGMPRQGYISGLDTFNLLSSSDDEIKFTVTGYFGESEEEITQEITHEIIMINTANGWRFSKFDVAWGH